MSESLTELLLRLSEGGAPALLSGREARPFFGPEFDDLLHRQMIVERAPATEWSTCDDCECDLDARPISLADGRLVAACPFDWKADVILDKDDLRMFEVDIRAVLCAVGSASGFVEQPYQVADGIWFLGQTPTRRAIFIAPANVAVRHPMLVQSLRAAAPGAPISLLAPQMPTSERMRLTDADIHHVVIGDAMSGNAPLSLDLGKLVPVSMVIPRLILDRPGRMLILDGRPTGLSPRAFDLLWLLAQAASGDGRIVSRREIEKSLFGTQTVGKGAAADAIRGLRKQLGLLAGDREHTDGIIQTRYRQGYVLNLRADEVQLIS